MPSAALSSPIGSPRENWRTRNLLAGIVTNLPLFRHATAQHLDELARYARAQHVHRGDPIYHRGDHLHGLFAVAFGLVKLSLRPGDGVEKVYRLVKAGETFGEPPVFLERSSPVDAAAIVDTMLVIFPAAAVHALLERDANFARSLITDLSERVEMLVAGLEAKSLYGAAQRLAAYLESLVAPEDGHRCATVQLAATKTVIASMLGVTKETFSRLLHELAAQGLISVAKRDITLLDRTRLDALAHSG